MSKSFVDLTVVVENSKPLMSLFFLRDMNTTSTQKQTVLADDIIGFESVPSYEYPGCPHASVTLRGGKRLFIKEHVSTVAALVDQAKAKTKSISLSQKTERD